MSTKTCMEIKIIFKCLFVGLQTQKASAFTKAAIHFCKLCYLFCICAFPISVTLASIYEPSLPINTFWFITNNEYTILKIIQLFALSIMNFLIWEVICISGYGLVADLLLGTMLLGICQKVLSRFEIQ